MENGTPDKTCGTVDSELLKGVTEQQKKAIINWEQYVQFNKAMSEITSNMKEIPILPSQIAPEDDRHTIQKVELPPEGGVLTYMSEFEYPYRGFPFEEFVTIVDVIKKIVKGSLSGLFHSFRTNKPKILLILPTVLVLRELLYVGTYTFHRLITRYKIKAHRYSQSMRELYRAISNPRKNEKPRMMELRLMARDVICMILEFDNAYRFRVQDILGELNKYELDKNPIKEINRLVDIASGRELEQQVKDTWRLIKLFTSYYLRFDRQLRNMVVDVLSDLNLERFKLMPEDMVYCAPRKDYVFGFMKKCH